MAAKAVKSARVTTSKIALWRADASSAPAYLSRTPPSYPFGGEKAPEATGSEAAAALKAGPAVKAPENPPRVPLYENTAGPALERPGPLWPVESSPSGPARGSDISASAPAYCGRTSCSSAEALARSASERPAMYASMRMANHAARWTAPQGTRRSASMPRSVRTGSVLRTACLKASMRADCGRGQRMGGIWGEGDEEGEETVRIS